MKSEETQFKKPRLDKPVRISEQAWPEGTEPTVSVFCITYNHENFIRDALDGFLMQETNFPVEIIIHDDASTDSTAKIVTEYSERYPNLFRPVLQTENQWSKGNRIFLIDYLIKQRGEFIALCEGDDYWTNPHKLQKQVEILESETSASLCFHNSLVDKGGDETPQPMHRALEARFFGLDDILSKNWFIPTASIVLRAKQVNVPEMVAFCQSGDMCLLVSAALSGKLIYWREIAGVYRKHAGGLSAGHTGNGYFFGLMPNWFWMFEAFRSEHAGNPTVASMFVTAGDRVLSRTCSHIANSTKSFIENPSCREIEDSMATLIRSACPGEMSQKLGCAEYSRELSRRIAAALPGAFSYAARSQAKQLNLRRSWKISCVAFRQGLFAFFAAGTEMATNLACFLLRLFKRNLQELSQKN
jgi:glycosyltransferase involved in cell wall biosynthesis